ncbi:MAG: hypothetical protein IPL61_23050 [Myxococcales bacterium]|nr:hypothetical protein [Myxococcales bacterium]
MHRVQLAASGGGLLAVLVAEWSTARRDADGVTLTVLPADGAGLAHAAIAYAYTSVAITADGDGASRPA